MEMKIPIDAEMSWLCGRPIIDLIKLEELLKKRHIDFTEDLSMSQFVTKKFGREYEELILKFI
ncbi:hypothetical protein EDL98_01265 [Ornithobacterium rhinotracheale]|nr:hypothetical protein [Ornithobacterium rhinotracheale]